MTVSSSYIAIIGDIVSSRQLSDRGGVQRQLKTVLESINRRYRDDLASQFMITLGDEFQGLLHSGGHVLDILRTIEQAMLPVRFRFGIGVGTMATDINPAVPLGADGPAYHHARAMIDRQKSDRHKGNGSNILLSMERDPCSAAPLVNAVLSLCCTIRGRWSKRQTEIVTCYLETGKKQRLAAEALCISISSVSKALQGASFYAYQDAQNTVRDFFAQFGEDQKDV